MFSHVVLSHRFHVRLMTWTRRCPRRLVPRWASGSSSRAGLLPASSASRPTSSSNSRQQPRGRAKTAAWWTCTSSGSTSTLCLLRWAYNHFRRCGCLWPFSIGPSTSGADVWACMQACLKHYRCRDCNCMGKCQVIMSQTQHHIWQAVKLRRSCAEL